MSKLEGRHQRMFWVIVVLLVSIGLSLIRFQHGTTWESLGHALVIAGVLAGTVDRYIKDKALREVAQDISKFLIGYNLPKEIQDEIRELMATSIVRTNYELRLCLTPCSDRQVRLSAEFSFLLENFSTTPKDYVQEVALEKHENPQVSELRCDTADTKASYCYKTPTLALAEKKDEKGVAYVAGKKIKVQPKDRGLSYRLSGKYAVFMPDNAVIYCRCLPRPWA